MRTTDSRAKAIAAVVQMLVWLIGLGCVSIAVGDLWGASWGLLVFGAILLDTIRRSNIE